MLAVFLIVIVGSLGFSSAADLNFGNVVDPGTQRIVNRLYCDNSAAFALTGALEIANQRLTGEKTKLSEQEIVDCHYYGCSQILIGQLVEWLQIQDRLAPASGYYDFQSKQDDDGTSCRSGQAPDALDKIKIIGLDSIELEDVDDKLEEYGAVFACMDNREDSCPGYYRRKSQIVSDAKDLHIYRDNDADGIIDGYQNWYTGENEHVVSGVSSKLCYHNVLIVGTHSSDGVDYYIVRDSRGSAWARKGHFLIARGGNQCGIENYLKVLTTEARTEAKNLDPDTRCPVSLPKFCEESSTCTGAEQHCLAVDVHVAYDPVNDAPHNKDVVYDFTGRPECQDGDGYEELCGNLAKTWGDCMESDIQTYCAGSCLVCARENCVDVETSVGECAQYEDYCYLPAVRAMCARTCQLHPSDCGSLQENVELLVGEERPPQGQCHAPQIDNGQVLNGALLEFGEELRIECDAGYVLSGATNYCVIQNVYGPDSRINQYCIAAADNSYTGVGVDIAGQLAVNMDGTECSNWLEVVHQGRYSSITVANGQAYLKAGNNNYCRNPVGESFLEVAPFCLTHNIALDALAGRDVQDADGLSEGLDSLEAELAQKRYCFDTPACGGGYCDGDFVIDLYDYCFFFLTSDCNMSAGESIAGFMWVLCKKTCCASIGCVEQDFGLIDDPLAGLFG